MKSARDIQNGILAEFERDGRLGAAGIGVEVVGDVVTLTGSMSDDRKIVAAAEVALGVAGVHDIANELTVADGSRDDTAIARSVRNALRWNTAVPAQRIDTIVRHGVVTLRGSVEQWYERMAAEQAASAIPGVASVENHIVLLRTPTDDSVLHEEVEEALAHVPATDGIEIHVAAGIVTLAGNVGSSAIRRQAGALAAAASGVRSVVNRIKAR